MDVLTRSRKHEDATGCARPRDQIPRDLYGMTIVRVFSTRFQYNNVKRAAITLRCHRRRFLVTPKKPTDEIDTTCGRTMTAKNRGWYSDEEDAYGRADYGKYGRGARNGRASRRWTSFWTYGEPREFHFPRAIDHTTVTAVRSHRRPFSRKRLLHGTYDAT